MCTTVKARNVTTGDEDLDSFVCRYGYSNDPFDDDDDESEDEVGQLPFGNSIDNKNNNDNNNKDIKKIVTNKEEEKEPEVCDTSDNKDQQSTATRSFGRSIVLKLARVTLRRKQKKLNYYLESDNMISFSTTPSTSCNNNTKQSPLVEGFSCGHRLDYCNKEETKQQEEEKVDYFDDDTSTTAESACSAYYDKMDEERREKMAELEDLERRIGDAVASKNFVLARQVQKQINDIHVLYSFGVPYSIHFLH